MKFSFDAESYRKDLAEELKEKRAVSKDSAKEFLTNEQETKRYAIAKDIKLVSSEIRKMSGKESDASNGVENRSTPELQIETFDLSDVMPEDLKLYIDAIRLKEIKRKFGEKRYPIDLGADQYPNEGKYPVYSSSEVINRDNYYNAQRTDSEYTRTRELVKKENEIIDVAKIFVNEVTEGSFGNPEMLTHVVDGDYGVPEGFVHRYPHADKNDEIPEEIKFDIHNGGINNLWFLSGLRGGTQYFAVRKVIVICNPKSERFLKKIAGEKTSNYGEYSQPKLGRLPAREVFPSALASTLTGSDINIYFNKPESWADIADWVVDLYHSRLYKITEKTE